MKHFELIVGFMLMDIPLHQLFIDDFSMGVSMVLVGMLNIGVLLVGRYNV